MCKSCEFIEENHTRDNNRQINANKVFNDNDVKICCKCKQQKLYTEFYKCLTEKSGLDKYCKDCNKNDLKEYFRKECSTAFSKAIKNNNNNCLSIIGCDAQFIKLWFEFQFDKKNHVVEIIVIKSCCRNYNYQILLSKL